MPDREKVMYSLERCSSGVPDACRDCKYDKWPARICVQHLTKDALALIEETEAGKARALALLHDLEKAAENVPEDGTEAMPAHIVPRELLLCTWGHGWQESHLIGDDEDPECFYLTECVWINGHIMDANGSDANADSDYWLENYNRQYGVRIWTGDEKPTEEQRRETTWAD